MSNSELRQQAEDIHDQLPDTVDVEPDEIEDRLSTLVSDYKVPRDETLGRYYRVTGPVMGRYLLVNEVESVTESGDPDELLVKARAI